MKKSVTLVAGVLAAVLAASAAGIAIGASTRAGPSVANLALINGVIEIVQRDYVHTKTSDELTTDALKGMLTRLDPHSDYMDEAEFKESQSDLNGRFGGLGIQISAQDGVPKIISPIDDTPASRAGLAGGDLIVAIDGESTHGIDLQKIVRILRGTPGTPVKLTILRGTKAPFDVSITRAIIEVPSIKAKLEPNAIGYVRVTEFGGETADDFKKAVDKLKQDSSGKLRGLVIDLRNNPGGLLSAAISISGNFLDGGTVVSTRGRRHTEDHSYAAPAHGDLLPGVPIVVLINGASASASEIVSGALQDRHRATIMGTPSFGKGSVQSVIPLTGHGALRLTTALYYTPAGRSIQGEGITPDVVAEAPKDQQVEGALLLSENELSGAFKNPGRLGGQTKNDAEKAPNPARTSAVASHSPPIKVDLIGTDNDGQLKAAIAQLEQANGCGGAGGGVNSGVNGAGANPCPPQPAQQPPAPQQPAQPQPAQQ
jgi:carboxyl-terminal processing protease